jgi:uncharacterized protein (DUF1778 family)
MARKPNPDSGRLDLRADPEVIRLWVEAAEMDGLDLSTFVRRTCTHTAKRMLAKSGASGKSTRPSKKVTRDA